MTEESIVADALVESLRTLHQDDPAPVYVQIERRIRMGVADGTLQPGDHLPSVRDLARKPGCGATGKGGGGLLGAITGKGGATNLAARERRGSRIRI